MAFLLNSIIFLVIPLFFFISNGAAEGTNTTLDISKNASTNETRSRRIIDPHAKMYGYYAYNIENASTNETGSQRITEPHDELDGYYAYLTENASTNETRNKRIIDPYAEMDGYFAHIKYQVMLVKNDRPYCSGTIIGDRFILTAAHCVIDKDTSNFPVEPVAIVAGTNTLHLGDKNNRIYRYVKEIIVHKGYERPQKGYDVAVLVLFENFGPYSGLKRLLIPERDENVDNVLAIVSGFGIDDENFPHNVDPLTGPHLPTDLRYQNVSVLSENRCREIWGDLFHRDQLCARLDGPFTRRGVCHGDSGSGLAYDGKVIGIVSWGYECNEGPGGLPTIYTRVSFYFDFIIDIMNGVRDPEFIQARRYLYVDESFDTPKWK